VICSTFIALSLLSPLARDVFEALRKLRDRHSLRFLRQWRRLCSLVAACARRDRELVDVVVLVGVAVHALKRRHHTEI
jgi:hypothetical protein